MSGERNSQSENNKRIAKNTFLLYIRMLFSMFVSLYTSRVVLNVLGVDDFGIYNVVGGVVGMFTVLSGSMSAAISRFLTFELGRKDAQKLRSVFVTSVNIQFVFSFAFLLLTESVGFWFLNEKMNIDSCRLEAANWVLQCSIFTFVINLVSLPYHALIIAHERMKAFAFISILETLLKLLGVSLLAFSLWDKLVTYAVFLFCNALFIRLIYQIYCRKHFDECVYQFSFDKGQLKEMIRFAGWNFIGASSSVLKDHGVNIVINLFSGVAVNAARAVSVQVSNAIGAFVSNFMMALNPQITKSYASGSFSYMNTLILQGARLSFYLLLFFSLPVLIETETLLSFWLGSFPDHSVSFVRLILLLAMSDALSGTLITGMLATGKIRNYQIVVGGLQMLNFPISYGLLKYGFPPESTMFVAILISINCLLVRLFFLKRMVGLSVVYYLHHVVGNVFGVALLSLFVPMVLHISMGQGLFRFLMICFVSSVNTLFAVYFVGCSVEERQMIRNRICLLLKRKQ